MAFNKPLPEWNNPGVKPNQGLIDTGWKPDDKPPADVHNWWMNSSYEALKQLQLEAVNKDQIGVANGVAPLGADGKVPADMISGNTSEVETQLENHIHKDIGHVRFFESSGTDTINVRTNEIPLIDPSVTHPVPVTGVAFRFKKIANNTANVKLYIIIPSISKATLEYPVLDGQGKHLNANALVNGAIYTVAFNGTAFFLQGSGSGVTSAVRGNQNFTVPGSYDFVVPDGVSLITCYLFGAGGGGGGGGKLDGTGNFGGGGGGGGAFALRMLQVTPGTKLTIYVGNGGVGGAVGNNGSGGSYTFVTNPSNPGGSRTYFAYGGGGGQSGNLGPGYAGLGGTVAATGAGGATTIPIDGSLTGSFVVGRDLQAYSGGSGGHTGSNSSIGGGGGSAPSDILPGKAANGNTAGNNNALPVLSVRGGDGGAGAYSTTPGAREGQAPGGGGGGGAGNGGATVMAGAKGGDGRVMLYW